MTTTELPAPVSKLPLLIVGAVVALAIVLTVAILATSGPENYEPGTPEAALQDFLNAGLDGDADEMFTMLTAESRASCESARDRYRFGDLVYADGWRAELRQVTVSGAEASAEVRFRHRSGNDPFDSSRWNTDERFQLELVGGAWRVGQASWPWPFDDCTRNR